MRILVVDDDQLDRLAVRRALQEAGISTTVDEAASGAEALGLVGPGSHDCVLLDYFMPGDDSVALLRSISEVASDVPVVIFTGHGDEEVAVRFMKAGAVDYLPKASLSPERLATSLRYAGEMARVAEQRRLAEQALQAREAEFRTLANAIPQMAWMADTSGRRYWYNERWYEYTGMRPDESLGLGWHLVFHPEQRAEVIQSQVARFEQGAEWERTVRLRRRDGEYRWFLARAMPVRAADGEIHGWVGTDTDITRQKEHELERERLLLQERAARAEAERATQARDDMLAIVAHDLRTPLQAIALSASVLATTKNDVQRQRRAHLIQRSARDMQRLISDLHDIAGIESGAFSVVQEPVDVRRAVAEAVELFEPDAVAAGIDLRSEVAVDLPLVAADPGRLAQVLGNLLANGLKFTSAGGAVSLSATASETEVRISVQDTGQGIPPAHLPHIFDRYWRGHREARSGAGLGLAICKGIVEAHGGWIGAASSPGQGTTVEFALPRTGRRAGAPESEREGSNTGRAASAAES